MKLKRPVKEIYFAATVIFLLEIFLLLIFFRQLRNLFPPPPIGENGIVGFTQYFGYPFYFETIVFFVVIFSPFVFVWLIKKLKYK